ncbi:MAG: DUF3316 domain-containing protein [Bacteroidales bacterium]|nr:DUF3316 domain-containing protein [Bacteroidales bacterium]
MRLPRPVCQPLCVLLALLTVAVGRAQSVCMPATTAVDSMACCGTADAPTRLTTHTWLYGAGHTNILDTYLSDFEYTGPSFSLMHTSERLARWGKGRVTVQGLYMATVNYAESATDDNHEWDAQFTLGVAWHRNWHPVRGLRLAAGGMAELGGGFTYSSNGGNNPAQGRLSADLAFSGIAEYAFRLWNRPFQVRTQLDVPLFGAMFSPNYGQSYYEIYYLKNTDHNVVVTHPFNAPSVRWLTTCSFKLLGATLSVGYLADVRQSHVNNLKRHTWNNQFVIGYVRRLKLLR